jgi:hypothetical protein
MNLHDEYCTKGRAGGTWQGTPANLCFFLKERKGKRERQKDKGEVGEEVKSEW